MKLEYAKAKKTTGKLKQLKAALAALPKPQHGQKGKL